MTLPIKGAPILDLSLKHLRMVGEPAAEVVR